MVVLTSFSPPTEGIKHEQPSTKLLVNGRDVGTGTLYIAESALSWRNTQTGEGFSLLYPHIAVHAVTREIGNECLYVVVDTCLDFVTGVIKDDDEEDDDGDDVKDEEAEVSEMRFVPDDKGVLDAMYHAMNYCQSKNPDPPQDELSFDEDEDEEYQDADEEGDYFVAENGGDSDTEEQVDMDQQNGGRHNDEEMETDGQFEDAEAEN